MVCLSSLVAATEIGQSNRPERSAERAATEEYKIFLFTSKGYARAQVKKLARVRASTDTNNQNIKHSLMKDSPPRELVEFYPAILDFPHHHTVLCTS